MYSCIVAAHGPGLSLSKPSAGDKGQHPHPCLGLSSRAQMMDSSHNALLSPWSPSRAATQELALLISRMQANADQVERDILETQKRLQQVRTLHQGLGEGHRVPESMPGGGPQKAFWEEGQTTYLALNRPQPTPVTGKARLSMSYLLLLE